MSVLRISGFNFSYPGGRDLLKEVSLELEEGSFTLLVGATGSGKTTLLRSIKPELAPEGTRSGTIEVFGRDARGLDAYESSTLVGYVAQNPENQIVCDTVWHEMAFGLENLGIDQDAMHRRVAEVAHFFGIEPWIHNRTTDLSGGQKQVVTLASILVMQPRLLLLDEPTSQLDPVAEKNFLHALFRINRELGMTVVVATHSPETMAAYATGALRMDDGRPVAVGLDEFDYGDCADARPAQQAPAQPDGAGGTEAVRTRDLFFRYSQDGHWVLRGMDLSIEDGSAHAIIGGNGSGKSTLLRTAAGLLKPQRGKVKNRYQDAQVLMPQDPKALFVCDTVAEELREWQERCGYGEADIDEAARRFDLAPLMGQHPYDMSGGQQQKLALAKLLLTKPSLMLLDEPTKGLDPESKCEIAEILLELKAEGVTMMLVTHDLAFSSQVADTATMIFDGEATCTEPIADFFSHNIFYRPQADGFLSRWQKLHPNAGPGIGAGGPRTASPAGVPSFTKPARAAI